MLGSATLTTLVLVILLITSFDFSHQKKGSFYRQFPKFAAWLTDTLDIQYNSYYPAGATARHLYLGNLKVPSTGLDITPATGTIKPVYFQIEQADQYTFHAVKLRVKAPHFYILDGTIPATFSGTITSGTDSIWHARLHTHDSTTFLHAVPMSNTSFAIQTVKARFGEHVLGKMYATHTPAYLNPTLLEKQIDGRFDVDGIMCYNAQKNNLLYVYAYRNEFIRIDSNLSLISRHHTIDTISQAQITVDTIREEGKITLSKPPLIVNKRVATYGHWLFVNSNLPAKNEIQSLNKSSVVDVYNIDTGLYAFSFYIDAFAGFRMRDFLVEGHTLYALIDHYVMTYALAADYLTAPEANTLPPPPPQ